MQNEDQDVAADVEQCRLLIAPSVHRHAEEFAEAAGLQQASSQFQKDVIEAILWCIVTHALAPSRKRIADTRKIFLRVGKEAAAAAKTLDHLRCALDDLPLEYRELLNASLEVPARIALSAAVNQGPWFEALLWVSDLTVIAAKGLKGADMGGAPPMAAFRWLVLYLARAFERATGRAAKATWNEHRERFEGKFVALVEEVLPLARLYVDTTERPMRYPATPLARGKYIHVLTREPRTRRDSGRRAISRTPD